ncbi:hypothetical protein F5884DRAFT_353378 [Xylogone sp. PMI_703]|nr:hypothetical protein F5884DRAFT_353378 [Xylogone sp. PMI_703]
MRVVLSQGFQTSFFPSIHAFLHFLPIVLLALALSAHFYSRSCDVHPHRRGRIGLEKSTGRCCLSWVHHAGDHARSLWQMAMVTYSMATSAAITWRHAESRIAEPSSPIEAASASCLCQDVREALSICHISHLSLHGILFWKGS